MGEAEKNRQKGEGRSGGEETGMQKRMKQKEGGRKK